MYSYNDFILTLTDENFNPIHSLFERIGMRRIAEDCGFIKTGPNSLDRLPCLEKLSELAARGKSVYAEALENGPESLPASEKTLYNISSDPDVDWLRMQVLIGAASLKALWDSWPEFKGQGFLVVDDTVCEYGLTEVSREALSVVYDHNKKKDVKGFSALQIGWACGRNYIPIALIPVASGDDSKLIVPEGWTEEGSAARETNRICRSPKPEVLLKVIDMLREEGIEMPTLEGDSWYTSQKLAIELKDRHTSLIGRLKKDRTGYCCDLDGSGEFRKWTTKQIMEKNRGRVDWDQESSVLLEVEVRIRDYDVLKPDRGANVWSLKHDIKGKIVFCRGCSSQLPKEDNWIPLLTTEEEEKDGGEVAEEYFARWNVELFFKDGKQILLLVKGTQKHTLVGLFGHYTFLMLAYIAAMFSYIEENLPTVTSALHGLSDRESSLAARQGAALLAWNVYLNLQPILGDEAGAFIANCIDGIPAWMRRKLGFRDGDCLRGG